MVRQQSPHTGRQHSARFGMSPVTLSIFIIFNAKAEFFQGGSNNCFPVVKLIAVISRKKKPAPSTSWYVLNSRKKKKKGEV